MLFFCVLCLDLGVKLDVYKFVIKMNEIHLKFKPFVIGTATVFFLLFYLAMRSPECSQYSSSTSIVSEALKQQVPQMQSAQPFTIYAITPTYTRPVQKAELTRYGISMTFPARSFVSIILFEFFLELHFVRGR